MLSNDSPRLGFIGFGAMESRIVRRLLEHGYPLIAYNRRHEAAEALVQYGARIADSVPMLASEADMILQEDFSAVVKLMDRLAGIDKRSGCT